MATTPTAAPSGRRANRPPAAATWAATAGGCFSLAEVEARDFKLDSFKWLKDDSLEDADELPPPEELATDAISELEGAVEELNAVLVLLENGNGNGSSGKRKTAARESGRLRMPWVRTHHAPP